MLKSLTLALALWWCGIAAYCQPYQVNIVNFTVKSKLPSHPEEWINIPGAFLLTAQRSPQVREFNPYLQVQVRANGAVICGNNSSTLQAVGMFDVRTFSHAELAAFFANCKELKDGNYQVCAQFFSPERKPISAEVCRDFTVETPKATEYARPTNLQPVDKAGIKPADARAITFRWTPVVPPPPNRDVVYRVKVWQLMQGQNPSQAIRSNAPVAEKEVQGGATQTVLTNVYTGPCRPPYLCDFVWTVQAVNKEGKPYGENNGTSEPTAFSISQYIIQLDSIRVNCTAKPGVYSFSFTLTNPNPGTANLSNFTVTSSTPAGAALAGFSPPVGTSIPSGNQLTVTGTLNASPSLSNICIGAEITDAANSFWKASKDTCIAVAPCKCDKCDGEKVVFNIPATPAVTFNNNSFSVAQNISIATTPLKPVKELRAELVYFEYLPQSEDCLPCNKDSKTYGNFMTGNAGNINGTGSGNHGLAFAFTPSKNFSTPVPVNYTISTPPQVSCCSATIRWCIRWVAVFDDGKECFTCTKLVCYETKKEGCGPGNPDHTK